MPDERNEEDRRGAEDRDRRHGRADLTIVGPDDRGRRQDRRVAAHRRPDTDEHGHAPVDAEAAPHDERESQGGTHRRHHEADRVGADHRDRAEVQAQAEQDDPELEHVAHGEPDARHRPVGRATQRDHRQAQQHGQRDLEADRERVREELPGDEVRHEPGRGREQQARQHARRVAPHPYCLGTRSDPDPTRHSADRACGESPWRWMERHAPGGFSARRSRRSGRRLSSSSVHSRLGFTVDRQEQARRCVARAPDSRGLELEFNLTVDGVAERPTTGTSRTPPLRTLVDRPHARRQAVLETAGALVSEREVAAALHPQDVGDMRLGRRPAARARNSRDRKNRRFSIGPYARITVGAG